MAHKSRETEVGGLLEQGANPAQKNSSGQTAQEVGKPMGTDSINTGKQIVAKGED